MENLTNELQIIAVLLLLFAIPFLIVGLWVARQRRRERRARDAMKRGNQIYSKWRSNTGRPPLE